MRILLGLVVAAIIISPIPDATAWSPSAASIIVPGHSLGPVTLGMPAAAANAAAAQLARSTGRAIDLLFRNGVVAAVGTARGAHLELQLSNGNESFLPRDAIGGQSAIEISGSPDQLVNALGAPQVAHKGQDNLVLIFGTGLVAQVRQSAARGAVVTYLAAQTAGVSAVPAVGFFAPWNEGPARGTVVTYLPVQTTAVTTVPTLNPRAQWNGELAETAIAPGHSFGPVMLGMPIDEAQARAARFERQTGCNIDLLAAEGVVIAAGSPWGGCLELQLPREFSAHVGIGGHPATLMQVFGIPLILRHSLDRAALIFADGLVAHVGTMRVRGGMVTYLAIRSPVSSSLPPIGHFADWPEARVGEAVKAAKYP